MSTDLACCFCPADRFPNRARLNEHLDDHRVAELATRPADPLAVLREALVWAEDTGLLRLAPDDAALLDVAQLVPGKPIPGYAAVLVRSEGSVLVRVALPPDGRTLAVMVTRPSTSLRVRLPPEFHMALPAPAPRDTAAIASAFEAAVEAGLRAAGIEGDE